jgi:hypothetical protein
VLDILDKIMNVHDVFGHKILTTECKDPSIYKNKMLTESVDMVFNSYVVVNRVRQTIGDSQKAGGWTSVGQPYPLVDLPGADDLREWVTKQFIEAKDALGYSDKPDSVTFKRSWTNRMKEGGYGHVHNHVKIDNYISTLTAYSAEGFCPDAVGILYVKAPPGSSNLVIINNGCDDVPVEYFPEEDQHPFVPYEGLMIIHRPDVWHGVTKHMNSEYRDVFVFDIDYK